MAGFVKKTMGPWSSYCTFAHILENYLAKPQGIMYWPSLAYTEEAGSLTDTSLELGSDSLQNPEGGVLMWACKLRIGGRDLYLSIGVHLGFLLSLLPMKRKFAKTLLNLSAACFLLARTSRRNVTVAVIFPLKAFVAFSLYSVNLLLIYDNKYRETILDYPFVILSHIAKFHPLYVTTLEWSACLNKVQSFS